jgi:hypothetical protein
MNECIIYILYLLYINVVFYATLMLVHLQYIVMVKDIVLFTVSSDDQSDSMMRVLGVCGKSRWLFFNRKKGGVACV